MDEVTKSESTIFSLDGTSIKVIRNTVSEPFDYETEGSFALTLSVTDASGISADRDLSIVLSLEDVNEQPTFLRASDASGVIAVLDGSPVVITVLESVCSESEYSAYPIPNVPSLPDELIPHTLPLLLSASSVLFAARTWDIKAHLA